MNKELVYLVQTDTTVGFSSSDDEKLSNIKHRPTSQKILQTLDSYKTLQKHTRIPKKYRKMIRRASRSTFIYPNLSSFRVIDKKDSFSDFIYKFNNLFSTSANRTQTNFEYNFACENSDVIVFTNENFSEKASSSIFKVSKKSIIKIR